MRSKWSAICLAVTWVAILGTYCSSALADTLVRKDNTRTSGRVISLSDTDVVFLPDGAAAAQRIPMSQVLRIELGASGGAPPAPQPAAPQQGPEIPAAPPPANVPTPPGLRTLTIQALTPPQSPYVTDAEIGDAISKGAKYLAGQFVDSTLGTAGRMGMVNDETLAGSDALAVYALLQCGMSVDEPAYGKDSKFMKALIDKMKTLTSKRYNTYTRGIRATCLSLIDRPEDRPALEADVRNLLNSCNNGGYTYNDNNVNRTVMPPQVVRNRVNLGVMRPQAALGAFDNSNSQYGLLGVWSAAEVGAEVPDAYWRVVEQHWTMCQCTNGQWAYAGDVGAGGTYSMTMAGLASMFVCHEYLDVAQFGAQVGREPFSPPLAKGLAWMETGDNSVPPEGEGYSIYGLERVGLASGFKYFGAHDWYREVATDVVQAQQADGSWAGAGFMNNDLNTADMLLFLSRGRHPILMNKLRFEHYWDNRPRDLANLASYAGKELETTFNWQVVNLQHDWHDWTDSPILYIASHVAAKLTDADYAKIRAFVDSGGMLFTQADGGSAAFNEYVQQVLLKKVFPDYELEKVPSDSPIYSVYEAMKDKPALEYVTNGDRALWVHSPADISQWWQQRASKSHAQAFELGMNLFVYAAGKRDFQNRIATSYIPQPEDAANGNVVNVARVKYPLATWNPEPYAWTRFANYLQWQTSIKVRTQAVDMEKLGDLSPAEVPLAHLTGTLNYTPSQAQLQSLKKYVDNGGILFIDACGGGGFNDSIKDILAKAFPNVTGHALSATSPLLSKMLDGMSALPTMPVRQYVTSLGEKPVGFECYSSGKGQVIYSPMDVTNGLLGSQTWGIAGYTTPFCLDFLKNLVLWSAQGAPTTPRLNVASLDGPAPSRSPAHVGDEQPGQPAALPRDMHRPLIRRNPASPVTREPPAGRPGELIAGAVKTQLVGGPGGGPFTQASPAGQPVIGFNFTFGRWGSKDVMRSFDPLYTAPAEHRELTSTTIYARPGYIVGGLIVDADETNSVALQVIFVRYKDGRVDPSDNYKSDWIGAPDSNTPVQLAGKGETVIGVCGHKGMNLDSVGLVVMPAKNNQQ